MSLAVFSNVFFFEKLKISSEWWRKFTVFHFRIRFMRDSDITMHDIWTKSASFKLDETIFILKIEDL